MDENLV